MKKHTAAQAAENASTRTNNQSTESPAIQPASFDMGTEPRLSDLRRLQDPDKFGKARFNFKLYKR